MMNKSLRVRGHESSRKHEYGFQHPTPLRRGLSESTAASGKPMGFGFQWVTKYLGRLGPRRPRRKKEPPFPAAFEVDNREASNRVDRSHSVSKEDVESHKRESLIDRK
jgi:hypothetical protein